MDRAHRPGDALGHRLEHVDHLRTTDLADDDPLGREPLDRPPEVGERHGTDAFGVRAALHEDQHVVVPSWRRVEMQLGLLLEHDDPLVGLALVQQRPQQGRLADALPAGDQHVAAGPHERGEQRRQALVVHAAADEILLVGVDEEVAADRRGTGASSPTPPRRGGSRREAAGRAAAATA